MNLVTYEAATRHECSTSRRQASRQTADYLFYDCFKYIIVARFDHCLFISYLSVNLLFLQGFFIVEISCNDLDLLQIFIPGMSEIRDRAQAAPAKSRKFRDGIFPVSG